MIYDNLDNVKFYKNISADILEGLRYLQHVDLDTIVGVHQITPKVKAIVSEYETKPQNDNGYEAHKKYIDIQYLLKGSERVACLPLDRLKETVPYSEERDAAFFTSSLQPIEMTLGDGYFAIFFPQDGHMPQLSIGGPEMVKKVVVKVGI